MGFNSVFKGLKSHLFGDKDRRHVREFETAQSTYNRVLLQKFKIIQN